MEIRFLVANHRKKRVLQILFKGLEEKTLINIELKKDNSNWCVKNASILPEHEFGYATMPRGRVKTKVFTLYMPESGKND